MSILLQTSPIATVSSGHLIEPEMAASLTGLIDYGRNDISLYIPDKFQTYVYAHIINAPGPCQRIDIGVLES